MSKATATKYKYIPLQNIAYNNQTANTSSVTNLISPNTDIMY